MTSRAGDPTFDVAVIGGGPAGATVASLLAERGLAVLVADAGVLARGAPLERPPEVLPPPALRALAALDLVSALDRDERVARPCLGIRRRWAGDEERSDFLSSPGGRGWIVERPAFDALLATRAKERVAAWWSAVRLSDVKRQDGGWRLLLTSGEGMPRSASVRFVIDASGRSRAVVRRLGIRAERTSYLVARPVTWQEPRRLLEPGWLDVWTERDGWSYGLCDRSGASRAVALRLPDTPRPEGPTGSVLAAGGQLLERCAGAGWSAVGDAAAAYDPITSEGLSHALGGSLALAPAVHAALTGGGDVQLRAYEAAVRATFWHAERGARHVYAAVLPIHPTPFWNHLATMPPRRGEA
jgi:flavin-dependent dehydrogenase